MSEVLKACGHNPDLCLTVTGFGDAGAALVASPGVDKIIFTGSPEVRARQRSLPREKLTLNKTRE